jgi:hypothetical protein
MRHLIGPLCNGFFKGLAAYFFPKYRKQETVSEPKETLGEVVEFLTENPDKMFILGDKTAVMIYWPADEAVLVIDGDFDGSPTWCNFMLAHRLHEMGLMTN